MAVSHFYYASPSSSFLTSMADSEFRFIPIVRTITYLTSESHNSISSCGIRQFSWHII